MSAAQTLGKFEIRRQLGRGAMGTVYEGWDPIIKRQVAIKTVRLPVAADDETIEEISRFRREAEAAGRLNHPNIVGVFDYGETTTLAYIVMEYVDGPTLKSLLDKQERFPLSRIGRIMEDLLAGLQFSHDRGVVHRDIKPANVMLTASGQAKIADFGIARIESSSMTQAGTVLGTPAYMSPEQFMGMIADARSDIYSAGVLLYQLLTGARPFEGTMSSIMHKALHLEAPPPSMVSATTPPQFDALVRRAMEKRPEDRFPTAAKFAAAIREAIAAPWLDTGPAAPDEPTIVAIPRAQPRTLPVAPPPSLPRELPPSLPDALPPTVSRAIPGSIPGGIPESQSPHDARLPPAAAQPVRPAIPAVGGSEPAGPRAPPVASTAARDSSPASRASTRAPASAPRRAAETTTWLTKALTIAGVTGAALAGAAAVVAIAWIVLGGQLPTGAPGGPPSNEVVSGPPPQPVAQIPAAPVPASPSPAVPPAQQVPVPLPEPVPPSPSGAAPPVVALLPPHQPVTPIPAAPTPVAPILLPPTPGPTPAGPNPVGLAPIGPTRPGPTPAGPNPVVEPTPGPTPAGPTPVGLTPGPTPAGPTTIGPTAIGPSPGLTPAGPTPAGPTPVGLTPGPRPAGPTPAGPTPVGLTPGPTPPGPTPAGPTPVGLTPGPTPVGPSPGPTPAGPTPAGFIPGPHPAEPTPAGITPPHPTPAGPTPAGPTPAGPTPVGLTPVAPTPAPPVPLVPIPAVPSVEPPRIIPPPMPVLVPTPAPAPAPIEPLPPARVSPLERVRDLAESVPCSALKVTSGAGGMSIAGIAAAGADFDRLLTRARETGRVTEKVGRAEPFACEPLAVVAPLARQSWHGDPRPLALNVDRPDPVSGGRMAIAVAGGPPVVYVDLYREDGSVHHLMRPSGSGTDGHSRSASVPVTGAGPGLLVAIGTAARLDLGERPATETASDYLAALRSGLRDAPLAAAVDLALVTVRPAAVKIRPPEPPAPRIRPAEPAVVKERVPQPSGLRSGRCSNIISRAQMGETLSNGEIAALRTECRS